MNLGIIEIIAAMVVLFSAMWDPRVSAAVAVTTLIVLGIYKYKQDKKGGGLKYDEQEEKKRENLEKIMGEMALRQRQNSEAKITNDEVEKMLSVSNATAERYLDELEKSGRLEQVGRTGLRVFYRLK